ncbi:hypothetical protein GQ53DRAFT_458798 [Thozetella sp. PMI_491]|nr:hypothetical protein GQ53DRAFT_458798 [Thozetella sp. PMI_491]
MVSFFAAFYLVSPPALAVRRWALFDCPHEPSLALPRIWIRLGVDALGAMERHNLPRRPGDRTGRWSGQQGKCLESVNISDLNARYSITIPLTGPVGRSIDPSELAATNTLQTLDSGHTLRDSLLLLPPGLSYQLVWLPWIHRWTVPRLASRTEFLDNNCHQGLFTPGQGQPRNLVFLLKPQAPWVDHGTNAIIAVCVCPPSHP